MVTIYLFAQRTSVDYIMAGGMGWFVGVGDGRKCKDSLRGLFKIDVGVS